MKIPKLIIFILLLIFLLGIIYFTSGRINTFIEPDNQDENGTSNTNRVENIFSRDSNELEKDFTTEILAENLHIPWEIVFLPDGSILLTERPGRVIIIENDREIIEVQGVTHIGEGGLMGAALHPDFESNKNIYLYFTSTQNGQLINKLMRYKLENNSLIDETLILDNIRGARNHDGGRISFGPDRYLYITTGDAEVPNLSQDTNSLNGKILRIRDDGSIPEDNPFGNPVYSYGHRNVQGITWDSEGTLWATEHGPSGAQTGWDELNLIQVGNNYGWPQVRGDGGESSYTDPIIHSGANDTWAPTGAAYYQESIFFGGLRGEALYEYNIDTKALSEHFKGEFGRIRAVVLGPDNHLYLTTSNTDGRGRPQSGDDKLIRIDLEKL